MDRRRFLGAASAMAVAPLAPPASAPRVRALVLTGGGARGAYQAGVIEGLAARGETFDLVCGTSIGAVNGALIAQGDRDALRDLWATVHERQLIQPIPTLRPLLRALAEVHDRWRGVLSRPYNVLHGFVVLYDHGRIVQRTGFLEPEPVAAYLREVLALERVRIPFAWTATNLTSARAESFYVLPAATLAPRQRFRFHRLDPARSADRALFPETIRASTAIPVAFPPVPLRPPDTGREDDYADGGVALNAPITVARRLGATDVVAVAVDPPARRKRVEGLRDVLFRSLDTNQLTLLYAQLEERGSVAPLRSISIVRPDREPVVGTLDFDKPAALREAFEHGRADGLSGPVPIPIDDPDALERAIEEGTTAAARG